MSFIENNLQPGEHIVYQARIRKLAYVYPLLLLAGLLMFGRFTGLATTELALTDKRVLGKLGMVYRKRLDLPHAAVAIVRVRQGLLGKLFDYGSVTIAGNDGSRILFRGIAEPFDVQMQIEEAVEMAVLGRKLSQEVMKKW